MVNDNPYYNPWDYYLGDGDAQVIRRWIHDFDPERLNLGKLESLLLMQFGITPDACQQLTWPQIVAILDTPLRDDPDAAGKPDPVAVKPMLHPDDLKVLQALANAVTTQSQYVLVTATGLSRKTIGDRLKKLREEGYTHRPNGERSGEAITDAGRAVLPIGDEKSAH